MVLAPEVLSMAVAWLSLLILAALTLVAQLGRVFGVLRGVLPGLVALSAFAGCLWWLGHDRSSDAAPVDWHDVASVSSDSCVKCHPDHHASWYRTYHRTMTREAAPPDVKADFGDAVHDYQGIRTRLSHADGEYFMDTVHPDWAAMRARTPGAKLPAPRYARFRVDRLVGSHWVQECLHRAPDGGYIRLPVLYHIVEKRWVHAHGAFLAPESDDFWGKSRGFTWNETCLYCHNTTPSKNPVAGPRGVEGYRTEVAELGISCEACHGPGGEHVRRNSNPARRFTLAESGQADPSIVNPQRLSIPRRDEICARCHGALVPRRDRWDTITHRDPFIAGQELLHYNHHFRSEAEQHALARGTNPPGEVRPEPTDGRFWGDGTPLTTALEYNGMSLSACYQGGKGQLSCLSCHTLHGPDPNYMLKPGMQSNEACYQCHEEYRGNLTAHTRHSSNSSGSLCYNCHMPHQVYSLLTTHRSHRIARLGVEDSLDTGKPHACNLCHLDRSLGWTQRELEKWPSGKRRKGRALTEDEEKVASSVLELARGDARTRVIFAAAFRRPEARKATPTEWFGPFLTRFLDDRYPMVRELLGRGIQAGHGLESLAFDPLGFPADRTGQVRRLRQRFDVPSKRTPGELPLTSEGRPDDMALDRLRRQRNDPDITINE